MPLSSAPSVPSDSNVSNESSLGDWLSPPPWLLDDGVSSTLPKSLFPPSLGVSPDEGVESLILLPLSKSVDEGLGVSLATEPSKLEPVDGLGAAWEAACYVAWLPAFDAVEAALFAALFAAEDADEAALPAADDAVLPAADAKLPGFTIFTPLYYDYYSFGLRFPNILTSRSHTPFSVTWNEL